MKQRLPDFVPLDRPALLDLVLGLIDALLSPVPPDAIPALTRKATRATRKRKARFVSLSQHEVDAYARVLEHVGRLRESEWLGAAKQDELLWALACEATFDPDGYRLATERIARAQSVVGFLLRPLEQYTVVIPLLHIAPPIRPIIIWDAEVRSMADDSVVQFFSADPHELLKAAGVDRAHTAVLVLTETGSSIAGAMQRALHRGRHRLHVLRTALSQDLVTHDEELRFACGGQVFARKLDSSTSFAYSWSRMSEPVELTISQHSDLVLSDMAQLQKDLARCHSTVRAAVERAYDWLGRGLSRDWSGDALRDFTTALEVLLIASAKDRAKSVLLPYRMIALADLNGSAMTHPSVVHYTYSRRSALIHEGTLEDVKEDAHRVCQVACSCLRWLVTYALASSQSTHSDLLWSLDTPRSRMAAVDWLAMFEDQGSRALAKGIRELKPRH